MEFHSQDSIQVLIAILWPWIQEFMKRSSAPIFAWIGEETKRLNFWLSPFIALLATTGFHFTGDRIHGWTLMIPPLSVLAHVAGQWVSQHIVYTAAIKHPQMLKQLMASVEELKLLQAPKP